MIEIEILLIISIVILIIIHVHKSENNFYFAQSGIKLSKLSRGKGMNCL